VRLPFGLGRRSSSGDGASSAGSGTGSGAASARAAAPSRAWASLPAIQRTAGPMPLVAAPGAFAGGLPGSQVLPPIVQPLGHEVSSLAAPGLVVARVRPVEHSASGTLPAPLQRQASRGSRTQSAAEPAPTHGRPETFVMAEAAVAAVDADAQAAVAPTAPSAGAPIRSMPTVSRMAINVPDRPLTSAAVAARPAAVQRATASASDVGTHSLPAPSGGMRRVPTSAGVSTSVASRQASAPAAAAAPSDLGAAPARRGLGEPLTAAPASARPMSALMAPTVSRSTISGPMSTGASALRPTTQRSPAAQASSPDVAGARATLAAHATGMPLAALPNLPVAGTGLRTGAPSVPSATVQRTATGSPIAIRPIAGANPIRPSVVIQRSTDEVDDGEDDGDGDGLPSPWWAPAADSPGRSMVGAGPGGDAGASLQRSTAGSSSPSSSVFATMHGTAGAAAIPGQPFVRGTPLQRSTVVPARTAMPVRGAADHSHGPSAAAAPAGETSISFPSRSIVGTPVVQTTPASGANAAFGPSLAPPPPGAVAVQRAEQTSPTPVPPAGTDQSAPRSERDLDELAQALFGRIRGRIRSELIHDREAKGLTFDSV
jgi:hypothetical protein